MTLHVGIAFGWRGREVRLQKKHEEIFMGVVNFLHLDCGSGFTVYSIVET